MERTQPFLHEPLLPNSLSARNLENELTYRHGTVQEASFIYEEHLAGWWSKARHANEKETYY
ncbi:hypothetical protein J6590_087657 [Homalodisca vitripennis]|nr:hypothetical protein J6590_087657 [Homalodisca vitripennis]